MNLGMNESMTIAIDEARTSLKEGNCGFGAVIVREGEMVARAHDLEKTNQDPTAHAEMLAIQLASKELGRSLEGCQIISTHEPCPMCSTAILWSGITNVIFGYSIKEAIKQGRKRINLSCQEIFERAGKDVHIQSGVMHEECEILYNKRVRDSIKQLRGSADRELALQSQKHTEKRLDWFRGCGKDLHLEGDTILDRAYQLFLAKLAIPASEAPIVKREKNKVVIHSKNFCPTLEACKILDLDTRHVCSHLTESPMADLLKQIDPRIEFSRNYSALRPYTDYCEEMIVLKAK